MNPALFKKYKTTDLRMGGIDLLEKNNLDGLILSSPANISYLVKYKSSDSYLLISKKENIFITDFRYIEEAKKNLVGCRIKKIDGSVFKIIADLCKHLKIKRLGFEERHLTFGEYKKIKEESKQKTELVATFGIVEELRQIKNPEEIEKIKKSASITIEAFKFVRELIRPGRKEIEIAAELERFIRYRGATSSSFDIIVASGKNSAYPHHLTSQKKLKDNEHVLIDIGVDYLGYKSDLTRVIFLGKITLDFRRTYEIVKQAQNRAINNIKPGIPINKIDSAARQYITQRGYGGFFGHNLGHGVGFEVHEAPYISAKEKNKLEPGMVFTVEPAIYLPGRFGIRIEDMVLVTQKGVEVISSDLDK